MWCHLSHFGVTTIQSILWQLPFVYSQNNQWRHTSPPGRRLFYSATRYHFSFGLWTQIFILEIICEKLCLKMAAARHVLTVPLAISAFVGVFYAIAKLMVFLSLPVKIPIHQAWIVNLLDDWSRLETSLLPLTIDAILIVTFILVHSFLRSEIIKSLWQKLGLASASRSIYNLATAATILVRFWSFTA